MTGSQVVEPLGANGSKPVPAEAARAFDPRVWLLAFGTFAVGTDSFGISGILPAVARDFDVLRHIRFGTEVLGAAFDEDSGTWRLALAGGAEHEADVLITATGQLSRPSTPAIPGLDRFEGTTFHSAEWDHDHDLTGERVAWRGDAARRPCRCHAGAMQVPCRCRCRRTVDPRACSTGSKSKTPR